MNEKTTVRFRTVVPHAKNAKKLTYDCDLCDKSFVRKFNLLRHKSNAHTTEDDEFICIECNKIFRRKDKLAFHIRTHKLKSHNCDICDKSFTDKFNLLRHKSYAHKIEADQFVCIECNKIFRRKDKLILHILSHTVKGHNCNLCDKSFVKKFGLFRHRASVHNTENLQFVCNECNKVFRRKDNLALHIRTHKLTKSRESKYCNLCDKLFNQSFNLRRHKACVHKMQGVEYVCNECNKVFQRKDAIVRHVRTHNRLNRNNECTVCHRNFSSEHRLLRHNYKQHGVVLENEYSVKSYKCNDCSMVFNWKYNIERHIRTRHLEKGTTVHKKCVQNCFSCDAKFEFRKALIEHYKQIHDIQLEYEYLRFPSIAEFQNWVGPGYFKENNWKTSVDFVSKYRCHRSGNYNDKCEKNNSKRKRHLKIFGSKKLQSFCPAEIIVRENRIDKSCVVTRQKVHIGHNIHDKTELRFARPNIAKKEDVTQRLLDDVIKNVILENTDNVQKEKPDEKRRSSLVKKVIYNIGVSYKTTSEYILENDPVNVSAFVHDNKESILFYKPQGEQDTTFNVFRDTDFVLIYQDAFQKDCLLKYGHKFVSFDATNKINPHNYLLHTMLVLDTNCEGIPVAYLLCDRNDQTVIDVFMQCIRNRVGPVVTKTVMSDIDEVYHKAFCNIMGPPMFNLFCAWHVRKEWYRKLTKLISVTGQASKLKRKSKCEIVELQIDGFNADDYHPLNIITAEERQRLVKEDIKGQLNAIIDELDPFSFENKLASFLSISDINVKPFIDYFMEMYANKTHYWAACYRVHAGANTNTHMEAFHRVLKYTIGNAIKIRTLSAGLDCIKNYIEYRYKFENKVFRSMVPKKLENLRKSHQEAEDFLEQQPFISKIADDSWYVGSFSASSDGVMEVYLVEKLEVKECKMYDELCGLRCTYCKSCFHEFRCTCFNSAITNNMCKHIHALLLSNLNEGNIVLDTSESTKLPIVSVEMPLSPSSSTYEEDNKIDVNLNASCELAKEKIKNIMEELIDCISPENVNNFDFFHETYIQSLPSIYNGLSLSKEEF